MVREKGSIIACCGHEIEDVDSIMGYWWKEQDGLSYGVLCPKCVPIYRAIDAVDYDDAKKKLENDEPLTLIDILEGRYGGSREIAQIGGATFEIYEV